MHDSNDVQKIDLHITLKILNEGSSQEFEKLVVKKLAEILTQLGIIIQKEVKMDTEIQAFMDKFNQYTNQEAEVNAKQEANITKVIELLKNIGGSADLPAIKAALSTAVTQLGTVVASSQAQADRLEAAVSTPTTPTVPEVPANA